MTDTPKKEHNTSSTEKRTHGIHHAGYQRGVTDKLRKEVCRQHKERCPRGMSHFQLVSCSDELRAVPKACRGLYRAAIHEGRNGKSNPTHQVVH